VAGAAWPEARQFGGNTTLVEEEEGLTWWWRVVRIVAERERHCPIRGTTGLSSVARGKT